LQNTEKNIITKYGKKYHYKYEQNILKTGETSLPIRAIRREDKYIRNTNKYVFCHKHMCC